MRVIFTRHAVGDVEQAYDHYARTDPELSARFVEDVDAAVERMMMFPKGAPPVDGFDELRRARKSRFPYGIFYQPAPSGDLLVVRVLHARRDRPGALAP